MAQLVALMSGVVLGGVAEVVGSNLARGKKKKIQHLSAQLIHYIHLYIYMCMYFAAEMHNVKCRVLFVCNFDSTLRCKSQNYAKETRVLVYIFR